MPSDRPTTLERRRILRSAPPAASVLLTLASLLIVAVPAWSQETPDGDFWWAVTVGAGSTRFTCDLCTPERDTGPWADVAVGASASESVRVGVEGGFWTHLDDGVREWVRRVGMVAHVYPRRGSGLHLIGGAGWSAYRAEEIRYDSGRITVGLGWDLGLTTTWAVGNSLTLDAASFGSLKNAETTVDRDVGVSVLRLGVFVKRR